MFVSPYFYENKQRWINKNSYDIGTYISSFLFY